MKFAYRKYEVDVSRTIPDGLLHRPTVPIRLIGSGGSIVVRGLLDTGADETIFPRSIAEMLGVELEEAEAVPVAGIGGHPVMAVLGTVDMEVGKGKQRVRWRQQVRFATFARADDEEAILGHAGFLDFFTATFDGKKHEVTLLPNKTLQL